MKGNRFLHARVPRTCRSRGASPAACSRSPRARRRASRSTTVSAATRRSRAPLRASLPLDELWPRFGYPNDLLGMLAARGLRVLEVPVRPVYADEQSGVRPWHALSIFGLIARRYLRERPTRRALPAPASSADGAIDDLLSEAE